MTDCCEGFERSDGAVMHSKDCSLSTPQPESVDDVRAALAEAIDALRPFSTIHQDDYDGSWYGIYDDDISRAAQVVTKHGVGR